MDFSGAYTPDHLLFLWDGFLVTLYVALISIVLSFIFGLAAGFALCENSYRLGHYSGHCGNHPQPAAVINHFLYVFCPSGNRDQTGNYRGRHHGADDF